MTHVPQPPNRLPPGTSQDPGEISYVTEALAAGVPLQDVQDAAATPTPARPGATTTAATTSTAIQPTSWPDISDGLRRADSEQRTAYRIGCTTRAGTPPRAVSKEAHTVLKRAFGRPAESGGAGPLGHPRRLTRSTGDVRGDEGVLLQTHSCRHRNAADDSERPHACRARSTHKEGHAHAGVSGPR